MICNFYRSTIGKKIIMASTGILLVLFVIAHMLGNLLIFLGPDQINSYAAQLKSMPALLWGARAGLLVVAGVHLVTAIQLKRINSAARPEAYRSMSTVQATTGSRYMYFSGSMILFYAIGHLLHFTLGVLMPENFHLVDAQGRHDVYQMVVRSFQNPLVAGLYVVAMVMLASHLSHGIASLFQTFGFVNKTVRNITNKLGPGLAYIIVVGYIAIPLSVVFGIVGGHP